MTGSKNNWQDAGRNGRSYLLRCWQEGQLGEYWEDSSTANVWLLALVPIDHPSNARGFATLEALCASLRDELVAEALTF